jgi:ABC-type nitrate/sulfonate/bicarbonate transport system ATPase subunit
VLCSLSLERLPYPLPRYPSMTKTLGDFKLHVEGGSFTNSEIVVMLGENGTGKSTLVQLLAGQLQVRPSQIPPYTCHHPPSSSLSLSRTMPTSMCRR